MASMGMYSVVSGEKGWIEDVVVNKSDRGRGIGRKLINTLIDYGKESHLSEIFLFTEDYRHSAIHLYADFGFKVKDSRIYVLNLK